MSEVGARRSKDPIPHPMQYSSSNKTLAATLSLQHHGLLSIMKFQTCIGYINGIERSIHIILVKNSRVGCVRSVVLESCTAIIGMYHSFNTLAPGASLKGVRE